MCPISKILHAEIRVNGIKLVTIGEYDFSDISEKRITDNEVFQIEYFVFINTCGTHWKELTVYISYSSVRTNVAS